MSVLSTALLMPGLVGAGSPFGPSGSDSSIDLTAFGAKFPKRPKENKEGEILVKFKAGVPQSTRDAKHGEFGNQKLRELKGSGIHHVRVSPDQTLDQALAKYAGDATVAFAEPNYAVKALLLPNEPAFNLLWAMQNTGQTLGTPGADIKAPLAWDLVTGSADVAVMVIDSGIDYTHQDLAANVWVNPGEIPGNGLDDDGNGYVDDVNGIDVVNGDTNPMDDFGHGTHVAGTIGAAGNNALGVVGVNWNVRLIPCKILDAAGNGTIADAVTCLAYAKDLKARGVNIVATNNSYGGLGAFSQTMHEAIKAQPDILFIGAAGNSGNDNDAAPFYPTGFDLPNVIAVAATDHVDAMPSFSNYGRRSVHLGAPGANITSTTPFDNYLSANGTSMASPHVAGLAALLAAQNPLRDWRQIKNLILAGGDPTPALTGKTVTGRRLNAFGSANCVNRPLFSVLKAPTAFNAGLATTMSALSINCGDPAGPVTATTSTGEVVQLLDDGVAPDLAAGDGIFSANWTPLQSYGYIDFNSSAGTERVSAADLAVTAVSGPTSANIGGTIALTATVTNPSTSVAQASTLNFYLSIDGVITTGDILLGSVPIPSLGAGAQTVAATSVTIPAGIAAVNYFIGAIVDPGNLLAEGDETNNAKAGNTIAISNVTVDLSLSSLSGPATAFTGDAITLSTTVVNGGSTAAPSSTLNFYASTDQVINGADTLIGTASVPSLAAGASQVISGSATIPVTLAPGAYYLGAIVDPGNLVVETNETNNTRVGNQLTTSTRNIDLTLTGVGGPATSKNAQSVKLTASVKNLGSVTAPASSVRWYLSSDNVITTSDIALGSVATPSMKSNNTQNLSLTTSIPATVPAGTYFIGAIVDPDNTLAETNNGNNALAGGTITVSYSVDLVMTAVAGPTAGATGQDVTFSGTVKNQGLAATPGNFDVGFYLSTDASITTGDNLIATATVPSLGAGASAPVSATAAIRTALNPGTYVIGAVVDPKNLVGESVETNNALAGNQIVVSIGPDLIMTAVAGPTSALRGGTITLTGTVRNQGAGAVGAATDLDFSSTAAKIAKVGFYLSTNSTITANDTLVGTVSTPTIAAGQSLPVSLTITLPNNLAAGTYYIGAIADYANAVKETNEVNNALTGNTIGIN